MATLDQVIQQFRANGMPEFPPGHPRLNTDRPVRYGPKQKAWYRLWEFRSRTGTLHIVGAYGFWGVTVESGIKVETDWTGVDEVELERVKVTLAEREKAEQEKRAQRARFAAQRAQQQWTEARKAPPENVATYLNRKGITHEKGLRYLADGTVLVPMIRYDVTEQQESAEGYRGPRRLVGLQKIAPDGTKRFNKGVGKQAAAFRLGPAPRSGDLILITEGMATGRSLRMAVEERYTVFVVFDAGNMLPAVKVLRSLYPKSPMLFCADDDAYVVSSMNKLLRENWGFMDVASPPLTEKAHTSRYGPALLSCDWAADEHGVQGIVGAVRYGDRTTTFSRQNAGRVHANKAAAEVGNASVVYPVFRDRTLPPEPDVNKVTDFNDLHQAEGLEVVRRQLQEEISRFELSRQVQQMVRESLGAQKRERKKKGDGGGNDEPPKQPRISFDEILERYTLIYPSDTVYDATDRVIARLAHVKHHLGEGVVKWWLAHERRRTVKQADVLFDPTCTCDPKTTINLFTGLDLPEARAGAKCDLILELLYYLCGEKADDDQAPITDWVLKWCAYSLQHVGAKMHTAVVMHGAAEGTGKGLFWSVLREIYGRYASLITQSELESPYNSWMSQRLFLIANEVISRQELRHHVGRLKNLITESPLPITEKYLPLRYEPNHMNMVFLTNELQALQIAPGDRRYMVIKTPGVHPKGDDFYKAVLAEMAAGGVRAFYQFLMDYDTSDFGIETKPILTQAKCDLIEMGYSSVQFFWYQLHSGELDVPYAPCRVRDLYRLYGIWCSRTGERNPKKLNQFSHDFMAMNGVRRKEGARIYDPDVPAATEKKQRSVFIMGKAPDGADEDAWISASATEFWKALVNYANSDQLRKPGSPSDGGGAQ